MNRRELGRLAALGAVGGVALGAPQLAQAQAGAKSRLAQIFEDQLLSLISNGVFNKFPDLTFVLLESGVTWLPGFIWRAVKTWRGVRAEVPWVSRSPAEIIRDNFRLTIQPFDAPDPEVPWGWFSG